MGWYDILEPIPLQCNAVIYTNQLVYHFSVLNRGPNAFALQGQDVAFLWYMGDWVNSALTDKIIFKMRHTLGDVRIGLRIIFYKANYSHRYNLTTTKWCSKINIAILLNMNRLYKIDDEECCKKIKCDYNCY